MAGSQCHLTPAPLKYEETENSSKCIPILVNTLLQFYLLFIGERFIQGWCCKGLPVLWDVQSGQKNTLSPCAISQQGLERWQVSQAARSCSGTFEHLCVNSILGKVCSFVGEVNPAYCRKMHVWRVSSAHPFPTEEPSGLAPADRLIQGIWHDLGHRSGLQCQTMLRPGLPQPAECHFSCASSYEQHTALHGSPQV